MHATCPPAGPVTVDSFFSKAWLVGRSGSLTAGIQYVQPGPGGGPVAAKGVPAELKDFNLALGYGTPGRGPLQPSFDFVLELVQGSKVRGGSVIVAHSDFLYRLENRLGNLYLSQR